ncbi:MAG: hypothetical protein HC936_00010 [Leptolyngbyaceae cyanobacterium SU_3_3]|nr:hypothetical protein [Leptolyngbyaceae cyanobacterium SU_3_3]
MKKTDFNIIQEYIDGHNLDENNEIKPGQPSSESDVVKLLIEILESLVSIHQQGVAHGNLKPSNLRRIRQDGHPQTTKIVPIDFGFLKEIAVLMAHPGQPVRPQQTGAVGFIPPSETGDWSEFSCDVYAVGMIGIQTLTGLEPKNLPKDQQTGEVIWRFATPDRTVVEVSNELARILTKMVRHCSTERYANALEVCQDLKKLQSRKRSLYSWLVDRRVLAASLGILVLTNIFSIRWYQQSTEDQKSLYQATVNNAQLNEQAQQCNRRIASRQALKTNLIDVNMVADAKQTIEACNQAAKSQLTFINQGKAELLLSQSSLQLNQKKDAQEYLNDARNSFLAARDINRDQPQPHFYLGLAKQLQRANDYQKDYNTAIDLYLKPNHKITRGRLFYPC